MKIEAERFKIEMTYNELWSTAWDVRYSLEATLRNHWINHQSTWETNEKERLYRLKTLFISLGRPELYDEVFNVAKEVFKKWNEKKDK